MWKMFIKVLYKFVVKRSFFELIDVLDGLEISVVGIWLIIFLFYFKGYEICGI